ncbi:MAG: HlyD family secretion protein, partial [Gammaproteobacteria bacterium]|nr:HlyD family secretion protein [Gammaproteobacteria bacterium]
MALTPRKVGIAVAAAVLASLAVGFWPAAHRLVFGPDQPAGERLVSGNIEAHESVLSFSAVQAAITRLPFDEGRSVAAGTVL